MYTTHLQSKQRQQDNNMKKSVSPACTWRKDELRKRTQGLSGMLTCGTGLAARACGSRCASLAARPRKPSCAAGTCLAACACKMSSSLSSGVI